MGGGLSSGLQTKPWTDVSQVVREFGEAGEAWGGSVLCDERWVELETGDMGMEGRTESGKVDTGWIR